jgi:hypothetical protein
MYFLQIYKIIYVVYEYVSEKMLTSWAPVAHTCNPSCSEGRDQEEQSLKPTQANSCQDPILKKPFTKKDWWSGSRCRS